MDALCLPDGDNIKSGPLSGERSPVINMCRMMDAMAERIRPPRLYLTSILLRMIFLPLPAFIIYMPAGRVMVCSPPVASARVTLMPSGVNTSIASPRVRPLRLTPPLTAQAEALTAERTSPMPTGMSPIFSSSQGMRQRMKSRTVPSSAV